MKISTVECFLVEDVSATPSQDNADTKGLDGCQYATFSVHTTSFLVQWKIHCIDFECI